MTFKKQPAGTQRSLIYKVRLKPHAKETIQAKLEWLRTQKGHEDDTISDLIRIATWEYCKPPNDPRQA